MSIKNFDQRGKTISYLSELNTEFPSSKKLILSYSESKLGGISITGTGCDKGWHVFIVTWLSGNNCYLNASVASPDANGNWCILQSANGRQSPLWWTSIFAISVKMTDVGSLYKIFEEEKIEGIPELERLLQKGEIPYKVSSGRPPA